jgi:hypothetical protein
MIVMIWGRSICEYQQLGIADIIDLDPQTRIARKREEHASYVWPIVRALVYAMKMAISDCLESTLKTRVR